jgi:hypothetical protein
LHDITFVSLKKPRSDPYKFWDVAEGLLVAFQRSNHVLFVDGISVQHFILRDQAARAFGEEDLMAELDRRLHLTAFDQVGVGFPDGARPMAAGREQRFPAISLGLSVVGRVALAGCIAVPARGSRHERQLRLENGTADSRVIANRFQRRW